MIPDLKNTEKETVAYDIRLHIEIRDGIEEYIVDVREDVIIDGEDGSNEYVEGLIFGSYADAKKQLTEFAVIYGKKGSVHLTDEAETDVITLDNESAFSHLIDN
tara:strand:+ start:821 stop:1132 length:312 start_codon:yes stop_codon:yes gene_type:complete